MVVALLAVVAASAKKPPPAPPPLDVVVGQLVGGALTSDRAYDALGTLSTEIGNRIVGSPALDRAVAWGVAELQRDGLVNVRAEPVTLHSWTRGALELAVTAPVARPLAGLSLGDSVGTAGAGIDADVVVTTSFDAFAALPDDAVAGKIVVWDVPFTSYGDTVGYRFAGATAASRRGAVASLVRSITPVSLYTPHTGNQGYDDDVKPIPAVAITVEDAAWLHRLQDAGKVARVHLASTAAPAGQVPSANVVGEVRGRSLPAEIVVLGCHLDSWDVGQGAQDDGAGCVQAIGAAAVIARQPVPPRRTVRVVLYTGEENGAEGAIAYAGAHAAERHYAAIESDTGAGRPLGFRVDARPPAAVGADPHEGGPDAGLVAQVIAALSSDAGGALPRALAALDAERLEAGYSGTDIGPLVAGGVPGFGLDHDTTGYWPIHHTEADTFDKVDKGELNAGVAAMAALAWTLAEHDGPLAAPVVAGAAPTGGHGP